jgi:hypothetical protein
MTSFDLVVAVVVVILLFLFQLVSSLVVAYFVSL